MNHNFTGSAGLLQTFAKELRFIVGALIVALIVGGGIAILAIYPIATTDKTSFHIAVAAMRR